MTLRGSFIILSLSLATTVCVTSCIDDDYGACVPDVPVPIDTTHHQDTTHTDTTRQDTTHQDTTRQDTTSADTIHHDGGGIGIDDKFNDTLVINLAKTTNATNTTRTKN